jgi:hypothetical protein
MALLVTDNGEGGEEAGDILSYQYQDADTDMYAEVYGAGEENEDIIIEEIGVAEFIVSYGDASSERTASL